MSPVPPTYPNGEVDVACDCAHGLAQGPRRKIRPPNWPRIDIMESVGAERGDTRIPQQTYTHRDIIDGSLDPGENSFTDGDT